MLRLNKITNHPQQQKSWDRLLASIPDADLDLLISAGEKMQRTEAILNSQELEACLRWYPQLDILPDQHQSRRD